MSSRGRNTDAPPALGASPWVSLLPPELERQATAKRSRRIAVVVVVASALVAGVGIGGAYVYSFSQSAALLAAQARTTQLLDQQKEFAEVRSIVTALTSAQQARELAGATDVDWRAWHRQAMSTLPAGASLRSVSVDSTTPAEVLAPPTVPLQADRVATITYQISTALLTDVPVWLDTLADLPGFADYQPPVSAMQPEGNYVTTVVIHVNAEAYSLRFAVAGNPE